MAGKWTVSCVYFGAEAVNRQREKVTAEPSLWLHTSHVPSLPGENLSPEAALHSLLGEDSELIFLVTAQAAVHTCVGLCWHDPAPYFLFSLFPLPPHPDVLDLLLDFSTSLANDIIGFSIVFLVFPVPHAFDSLSLVSHHFHLQLYCHCSQLVEHFPLLCFQHWAAGNNLLLLPPFPLSFLHSLSSPSGMEMSADVCLFHQAVNSLFCFTCGN